MEVLLGDGIFNVDGELWRKQRKTASFEFASKNLRDFSTLVFREYSLKLSDILSQACFQNQEVDLQVTHEKPSDYESMTKLKFCFDRLKIFSFVGIINEDDFGLHLQGGIWC